MAFICLTVSSFSYASRDRCDFDEREGIEFEFAAPEIYAYDSFFVSSDAKIYQNWFEAASKSTPLDYDQYYGRLGKIIIDKPAKTVKENTMTDLQAEQTVRYYSAIIDNCRQVYLRVVEDDFPQYFSPDLDLAPQAFDLLEQEMWAGITLTKNLGKLISLETQYVTVRPEGDRLIHFVDLHGTKDILLPRYTTLKVIDAMRSAFYVYGKMLSNYKIHVEYKGELGYINADYRYLFNNNPLVTVRDGYVEAVAAGKLKFGMTPNEVLLSQGYPQQSTSYPVYRTATGLYTDYRGNFRHQGEPIVSYVLKWKYDKYDWSIVFNKDGIFDEHAQTFNMGSARGLPSVIVKE